MIDSRWQAWAIMLVLAIASCKPQPPPPQPPPPMRTIAVVTSDSDTGTVYVDDTGGGHTCELMGGYCEVVGHDAPAGQTYITVKAPGFKDYRQDGVTLPQGNTQVWLGPGCGMPDQLHCVNLPPLEKLITPLPRLVLSGNVFRQENGQAFTVIEASGFTLYQQFLEGRDIEPVLAQLQAIGFNTVRVFGQYDNAAGIGHFRPENYGAPYWDERPAFYRRLAAHSLYGEWTQFADASRWTCAQQSDTAQRTPRAFTGITNALVEWVNEADQPINQMCPSVLSGLGRIPGILTSHGSNGSQAVPVMPFLDYITFHTNNAPEEERKVGHNCGIDFAPTPCLTNETSKAPNARNWTINPTVFAEDAPAGASLLAVGSAYHSEAGLAGRLLTGNELTYAAIWVKGAKKVPLSCQNQAYSHRTDLEPTGVLRAYQLGPTPGCVVLIRKST